MVVVAVHRYITHRTATLLKPDTCYNVVSDQYTDTQNDEDTVLKALKVGTDSDNNRIVYRKCIPEFGLIPSSHISEPGNSKKLLIRRSKTRVKDSFFYFR